MQQIKLRKGGGIINKEFIQRIKNLIVFLSDKKVILGIGIGLVLGTILMTGYKVNNKYSEDKIEEKAREMGMHYKDECRVSFDEN